MVEPEVSTSCTGAQDGAMEIISINYQPGFVQPISMEIVDAQGIVWQDSTLIAGNYCLVIKDGNGCWAGESCFTVVDPAAIQITQLITDEDCTNKGSILLDIEGGTGSYNIDWSDLVGVNDPKDRNNLDAGLYSVTVTDENGCTIVASNIAIGNTCISCDDPVLDSIEVVDASCGNAEGSINIDMQGEDTDYQYLWSPLVSTTDQATGLSAGIYQVTIIDMINPDCSIQDTIVVNNTDGPVVGSVDVTPAICGLANGTVTLSPSTYNYRWSNGMSSAARTDMAAGIYQITVSDNTGCTNIMEVQITEECPQIDTVYVTTVVNTTADDICISLEELPGDFDMILSCGEPANGLWAIGINDTCVTYQPNLDYVGQDTACVVVCDDYGVCDTTIVIITVTPFNCDELVAKDTMIAYLNNCDSVASVCVSVPYEEYLNYTVSDNGNVYSGATSGCAIDSSMTYPLVGLPGYGFRGPYILDAWTVNGQQYSMTFTDANELVDSMNNWDATSKWVYDPATRSIRCGDFDSSYGSLDIIYPPTGAKIRIEVTENIVPLGTSFDLGRGWHQIVLTNNFTGCTDTVEILVNCITPDIYRDTILVNQSDTLCLPTNELEGNIMSVENVCEDSSGEFVIFEIINGEPCVTCLGTEIGTDSACIVICDDLGLCDTTYMFITVIEEAIQVFPDANDDSDTTLVNEGTEIEIILNDTINGVLDSIYIVENPQNGTVIINGDSTFTYVPNQDYCDPQEPDQFTYAICNETGCDTATVTVLILCDELIVYTGLSPNGDGVNDVLYIEGIEAFPNNRLLIFNRWGNEVYRKDSYLNDWDGTWAGKALPDGTYFYILEDGEGQTYSGYIQILR